VRVVVLFGGHPTVKN